MQVRYMHDSSYVSLKLGDNPHKENTASAMRPPLYRFTSDPALYGDYGPQILPQYERFQHCVSFNTWFHIEYRKTQAKTLAMPTSPALDKFLLMAWDRVGEVGSRPNQRRPDMIREQQ